MKIAVFASTSGSDLPALFSETNSRKISTLLITNKKDCGATEKAKKHDIPCFFIDAKGLSREEYDEKVLQVLEENNIDYIFLVGYMRIISSVIVQKFPNKIFNIHPSLLPAFAGGMDTDVHSDVLQAGCKISGATLHIVTEEVDEGPIVKQKACEIDDEETSETLKKKVQKLEQEMLVELVGELDEER